MAPMSTLATGGARGAAPGGAAPLARGGREGHFYEATAAGSKHSPPLKRLRFWLESGHTTCAA